MLGDRNLNKATPPNMRTILGSSPEGTLKGSLKGTLKGSPKGTLKGSPKGTLKGSLKGLKEPLKAPLKA